MGLPSSTHYTNGWFARKLLTFAVSKFHTTGSSWWRYLWWKCKNYRGLFRVKFWSCQLIVTEIFKKIHFVTTAEADIDDSIKRKRFRVSLKNWLPSKHGHACAGHPIAISRTIRLAQGHSAMTKLVVLSTLVSVSQQRSNCASQFLSLVNNDALWVWELDADRGSAQANRSH